MKRKDFIILLFLFSLILGLYSSFTVPVRWWDETVYAGLGWNLKDDMFDYSFRNFADKNPDCWNCAGFRAPLLPYMISLIYVLFGNCETVLLLLVPLFGALGVVATFLLAEKMFGEKIARYSASALAVLPTYVIQSGRIMTDIPVTALLTFTAYFFWRGFIEKDQRSKLLFGLMLGISFLARYTTVWVAAAFFIYLLIKERNIKFVFEKHSIIAILIFLLTITPFLIYSITTYGNPLGAILHAQKAAYYWGGEQPLSYFITGMPEMFSVMSVVFLIGLVMLKKDWEKLGKGGLLLILWFSGTALFQNAMPHKELRFLLPLFPPLAIISGICLQSLEKYKKILPVVFIIISFLTGMFLIGDLNEKTDRDACFLEAADFLSDTENNSLIITDSSPVMYYYTKIENHFYTETLDQMEALIEKYYYNRTVYVFWLKDENTEDFRKDMEADSNFKEVFKCPNDESLAVVYKYLK